MAKIETAQKLIVEASAAKVSAMQLSVAPGEVRLIVDNEGVAHLARIDPNEATQLGVALIQLAHQAQAMAAANQLQLAQQLPPINGRGRGL